MALTPAQEIEAAGLLSTNKAAALALQAEEDLAEELATQADLDGEGALSLPTDPAKRARVLESRAETRARNRKQGKVAD